MNNFCDFDDREGIMNNYKVILLLVCLGWMSTLSGCAQGPSRTQKLAESEVKELPIPAAFKDKVQVEFALGRVVKTYDDVAWIGTDAAYAAGYKPKPGITGGYVVEALSDDVNGSYQLVFINELNGKPMATAFAQVKHDSGMGHVLGAKVLDPPQELSTQASLMYQALMAAKGAQDLKLCKATYNTVVFPYVDSGKTEYRIYFLMSTEKKGEIPIGGHVLVRVADDAKTILEVEPLSKSCGIQEGGDDPRIAAFEFTNLALDSPSAAQVFLMYRYEKPVYVITKNGFLWGIDSRGIRLLSAGDNKQ